MIRSWFKCQGEIRNSSQDTREHLVCMYVHEVCEPQCCIGVPLDCQIACHKGCLKFITRKCVYDKVRMHVCVVCVVCVCVCARVCVFMWLQVPCCTSQLASRVHCSHICHTSSRQERLN